MSSNFRETDFFIKNKIKIYSYLNLLKGLKFKIICSQHRKEKKIDCNRSNECLINHNPFFLSHFISIGHIFFSYFLFTKI